MCVCVAANNSMDMVILTLAFVLAGVIAIVLICCLRKVFCSLLRCQCCCPCFETIDTESLDGRSEDQEKGKLFILSRSPRQSSVTSEEVSVMEDFNDQPPSYDSVLRNMQYMEQTRAFLVCIQTFQLNYSLVKYLMLFLQRYF